MPVAGHDSFALYGAHAGRKYVNRAERQRAMAAFDGLTADHALYALTLAWTGARVSEVLALTPDHFQLDAGIVAIRTLKQRGRLHVREVPLPPELLAALTAHFDLGGAQRDPDRAFRQLWSFCRVTAWRVIHCAMREAGLSGRLACPRSLRHGFGVGTLQAGIPITLVQKWMGHARLSTTAIYTAITGPEEQSFAGRFWDWSARG